jgi:hypothetical protein
LFPKANFRAFQDFSGPRQGPEEEAVSFSWSQEDAMTDIISTAPIPIRDSSPPRFRLRRIGAGAALGAIAGLLSQAFNLAYVDPYSSLQRKPTVIPDNDLEGRDPNW